MLKIENPKFEKRDELYRTCPREDDVQTLVSESCEIYRDGKKWFTYLENVPLEPLRRAVLGIDKIGISRRQSGVPSQSRIFGFSPRMPVQQRDYCTPASLNRDYPAEKEVLFGYAREFSRILLEQYPEQHAISVQAIASVLPDWVMQGSVFTSGIINQDNPLQYHYDAGNFENTFSVMAVFKKETAGGHLILPEYGLKLACQDSSLLIFDGQAELHGVSPIRKMTAEAYRYSIVFYSLAQLCRCGTPKEEIRRAQKQRTNTEMKRAGLQK